MEEIGLAKRWAPHKAPELPDDLMQVIFSKLCFRDKVNAGKVCKSWDRVLKDSSAGGRVWDSVGYNIDRGVSSPASPSREELLEQFETGIGRWLRNRAGAIKSLTVSATLSSDERGAAIMKVLENHLPLFADCLSSHGVTMELLFSNGSLFASPLLSSPDFLTVLCPIVTCIHLRNLKAPITASQFAGMCQLTMLEDLHIECEYQDQAHRNLPELPDDLSKLVNLTSLAYGGGYDGNYRTVGYVPESISCLQKLNILSIFKSTIPEVPSGVAKLPTLATLHIEDCGPFLAPRSLQGLEQLTSLTLSLCHLVSIPVELCGLTRLTSLDLRNNRFGSHQDGWSWWPTALSRLTNLEMLTISYCGIQSLPPYISDLRGLTELVVYHNQLDGLPEELSCLQRLKELWANDNRLPSVPVSILSTLTSITTINLSRQNPEGWLYWTSGAVTERELTFEVSASLLPILHPGLLSLDLRQEKWDRRSLNHLESAKVELANRSPHVNFQWLGKS